MEMAGKSKFASKTAGQMLESRSGAVGMLFALAFPALLGAAGVAVDYASVSQSRSRLQAAADSAALSLAREMTVGPMTQQRVQEMAALIVNSNLQDGSTAAVIGMLDENTRSISIKASLAVKTPLGLLSTLGGVTTIDASAMARVSPSSLQTKLCMLSLATKQNGGLFLHNGSFIAAPECVLHSNSDNRNAVIIQNSSKITASLLCSRGGIQNLAGSVQATLLTDCPNLNDPLARKIEPSTDGPCRADKLVIGTRYDPKKPARGTEQTVQRTLEPGIYCGGITIENNARVKFNSGVYVMRDGPLIVRGNGELTGSGVSLLLTGKKSYFRFLDNSLIQLSAPTSGIAAGMLIWESRRFEIADDSWQRNNCNRDDDDDDEYQGGSVNPFNGQPNPIPGPRSCSGGSRSNTPGAAPGKKTNEHHINSDRARELTGTIYLPNGLLLIDSRRPVADQSPFTVLVANKVDLFDGPNLVLNANYDRSPVPVPQGLGAIGATQVRLGK